MATQAQDGSIAIHHPAPVSAVASDVAVG